MTNFIVIARSSFSQEASPCKGPDGQRLRFETLAKATAEAEARQALTRPGSGISYQARAERPDPALAHSFYSQGA